MTQKPTPTELMVERITAWVGSIPSLMVHSFAFIGCFAVAALGLETWSMVLLVLTTVVSLEAIYLAIFIQMSVNRQARDLHDVTEDVEEIQEDIEEISEDVEEMQEDVEEMQEDVEELSDDWDLEGKKDGESAEALRAELKAILAKLEAMNEKP